jgi:putative Mg2+ transporter-C (MgtC) family protein
MPELSTLDILIRLVAAALLCGAIGFEREYRHKPAGMRTNILVGIGTATVTIASFKLASLSGTLEAVDIARLATTAAGLMTGIGFIGAGTIIQAKGMVLGLTTAASIWVVAAIGLVTGLGLFDLAVIATVISLIALAVLRTVHIEESEEGPLKN